MNIISVTSVTFVLIFYKMNTISVFGYRSLDNHPNLRLLPDDCGERIVHIRNVSNRNDVFVNQFPFMVALQTRKEKPYPACVGSLISEKYVLTSAHCVLDSDIFNVRLGEYSFETEVDCHDDKFYRNEPSCNDPVQDIPVEKIKVHEQFEPIFKNDIALVRLANPADLTKNNVRTICLPTKEKLKSINYAKGQLTNFSTYKVNVLHELKRSFIHVNMNREKCENFYLSNSTYSKIRTKYICEHVDKITAKVGKNGAPLFQLKQFEAGQPPKFLQFGIYSGSDGTDNAVNINKKGGLLFVYIPEYAQWILDNLKP